MFEVIKKETVEPIERFTEAKDIKYYKSGTIDYENLRASSFEREVSMLPKDKQEELTEKGKTEFMIVTKTYVSLVNKKAII